MVTDRGCRVPIQCILPPHVLHSIAQNGSAAQRKAALATLSIDHTVRSLRALRTIAGQGRVPGHVPGEAKKRRTVYNAKDSERLPGAVVRHEGEGPTEDKAVDEAYDGLGATFDFYWEVYERNSIDDQGLPLDATVHFGSKFDNAYWDGERMVFGDGDGELFGRFTVSVDVIGHELTHGVTGDEAKLAYHDQSGALNESISDVFGSLVKQKLLKQTADEADWLIGQGLFTRQVQGVALRSMKAPGTAFDDAVLGKDPQPKHMREYVETMSDNGGVHINSGIPNRAFYLVASALGGHAWQRAGKIWYETVRDPRVRPNTTFHGFARRTVVNAGRLFGVGSEAQKACREGWAEVGVVLSAD